MRINENRRHSPIRFMRVARKMGYQIGNGNGIRILGPLTRSAAVAGCACKSLDFETWITAFFFVSGLLMFVDRENL